MNLKLEIEFSKTGIFEQVDALKKQIDDMRPLPPDVEGRVMQKLRLDWNYNSNAIEGNKLSYGETTALLMHGMTAKGKPLKDHLDIQGHNVAIDLLLRMVQDERPLTEADIRGLHEVILGEPRTAAAQTADGVPTTKTITVGEYKNLPNHVKTVTGEIHYYASPEETPAKMQELMEWYNEALANAEVHPIVIAALFHHRFVAIHPFDDGNGRMSRILMNLILMRNGYPVAVIKNDNKDEYYSLLSRADVGEFFPFVEYIIEKVESSLRLYLKAVGGGDINEDEDIDKEIALFKMELSNKIGLKERLSLQLQKDILNSEVSALFEKIISKSKAFEDLFFFWAYSLDAYFGTVSSVNERSSKLEDFKSKLAQLEASEHVFKFTGVTIHFNEFKNIDFSFSIDCRIVVIFELYEYVIVVGDKKFILRKMYHEKLLNDDYEKVVRAFINNLKTEINQKLETKKA